MNLASMKPWLAFALLAGALSPNPSFSAVTVQAASAPVRPAPADAAAQRLRSLPLASLAPGGGAYPVRLTGTEPTQYFDFALRRDEAVSQAQLQLVMTPSASLLPETSQVNVFLNGELQSTVQLTKSLLGQRSEASVSLDVRQLRPQNQISLQFIGHYQPVCENPANEALWLSVAPESRLHLTVEKLKVANDLSLFPAPFIDAAGTTNAPTVLPIVFGATPSREAKEAAALLASLAGKLAGWRGIELPVYYNEVPPETHFIVFAGPTDTPDFLKSRPAATSPTVTMTDAPLSRTAKMLVVSGGEGDLVKAVLALADDKRVLIGETLRAAGVRPEKSAPWTASKWLAADTNVTLASIAQYPGQLSAKSQSAAVVRLPLSLAPDLWITDKDNLTLRLAYRYTRPVNNADAQMRVTVNGVLADSRPVGAAESRAEAVVALPTTTGALSSAQAAAPGLKHANELAFTLAYTRHYAEGNLNNCRSMSILPQQLEVEPGSSLQLTGAYHWTKLPNLSLFASGGFPYSRHSDLSETVIVAPHDVSASHLSMLLTTIARTAYATGDAGLNLTLTEDWRDRVLADKDVLTAGGLPEDALADFNARSAREFTRRLAEDLKAGRPAAAAGGLGSAAVIASMESPFAPHRTLTALLSESDAGAQLLTSRLASPSALTTLSGTLAVVTPEETYSFDAAPTYQAGNLPWYRRVWAAASGHPLWISLAALLCAIVAGCGVYRFMRRQVKGRA